MNSDKQIEKFNAGELIKFPVRYDGGLEAVIDSSGKAIASTVELENGDKNGEFIESAINNHHRIAKLEEENKNLRELNSSVCECAPDEACNLHLENARLKKAINDVCGFSSGTAAGTRVLKSVRQRLKQAIEMRVNEQ